MTFLQLSLDSFTASNSKPWMHGNIKSPPNGKSSLRNIPISKFPQPLAQIPASSLRSSTISKWLYPVWTNVGFFLKKGFFKQKDQTYFKKSVSKHRFSIFLFFSIGYQLRQKNLGNSWKIQCQTKRPWNPCFIWTK